MRLPAVNGVTIPACGDSLLHESIKIGAVLGYLGFREDIKREDEAVLIEVSDLRARQRFRVFGVHRKKLKFAI